MPMNGREFISPNHNINMKIYPRIRKPSIDPNKNLRLHRAEFGHDSKKKNFNIYSYYPHINSLYKFISKINNIKHKHILIAAGGEAIIKDIFILLSKILKRKNIFTFEPNYAMYKYYSEVFNFKLFSKTIYPGKKISLDELKFILKNKSISVLALVNPSHPIEQKYDQKEIKELINFCAKNKIFVIIDEVYKFDFKENNQTYKKYNNVICVRSFSKIFGLPGLRVGYALANETNIRLLENFRLSIELSSDSIKFFENEISAKKILNENFYKVQQSKKFAEKSFSKRKINYFNSHVNSITFDCLNQKRASKIYNYFLKRKIFLARFNDKKIKRFLNVTTTNINNLKLFFKTLDNFYKNE